MRAGGSPVIALNLCGLFGHSVDKGRVWFDNLNFRTSCLRCRRPLLRDDKGWRLFDSATDLPKGGPGRKPHPRHDI